MKALPLSLSVCVQSVLMISAFLLLLKTHSAKISLIVSGRTLYILSAHCQLIAANILKALMIRRVLLQLFAQLQLEPTSRVLEIGTGSGFTAAVMAQISARVMTLDRYKKLCDEARIRLQKLKIENVNIKYADARNNIPGGPFDRIIAWVAYEELPLHLVDMLATHGVIIAPVGPGDGLQAMMKLSKVGSRFEKEVLGNVRYQPFIEGTSSFF